MNWNFFSQFTQRKKNVVGITTRAPESNFSWLKYLVMNDCSDLFEMRYLPITNTNRWQWEEKVRECSAIILYHTRLQGRINVANVEGALYDDELCYLNTVLGREKVMVLLDDMEDISEEERRRILSTQTSLDHFSSYLFLIPEKEKSAAAKIQLAKLYKTLSEGATTSQQKESSGVRHFISRLARSVGDTAHSDSKNNGEGERAPYTTDSKPSKLLVNPSHPASPPNQIGIFSRSPESNYKWLIDSLKEDGHKKSFDIKSVCITNDYKTFSSGLQKCRFAILYHTKKHGRLNITDATDSLYDCELRDMSHSLGRENVIVVVDDLKSNEPEDKERILRHQPSIHTYAKDLFLFTEHEKCLRSLETIREIIQRSQAKHNGPGIEHRTAPSRGRESSKKNHGYSVDGHGNRITPDQGSFWVSSPSCSGSFSHQTTSETSKITGSQSKRPKTLLPGGQINSIELKHDQPGFPTSSDMENSNIINNGKGECARNTTSSTFNPIQSPPPPYQIAIFSRSAESNYTWLISSLNVDDRMRSLDIKSVYITNDYETFRSGLETCRFAILYHTKKQGRLNITDVADSLYDQELQEMSDLLGKENVIVVVDDLKSNEPEDKERILEHQRRIPTYAKDLFLFTEHEKCLRSLETIREIIQRSQAKHNGPGIEHRTAASRGRESYKRPQSKRLKTFGQTNSIELKHDQPGFLTSGDMENSDIINNGKGEYAQNTTSSTISKPIQSPPPPYQIGIFSRSAESNYTWLINSLKVDDPRRLLDIKSVYITNDYETFRSGLETYQFAILYHTKKQGRLNITDVADSLYNEELRDMSNLLGKKNVIVVADDLKSNEPEDKERILRHQPSIHEFARDLFLFTEKEKYTSSLQTIKEMIWRRVRRSQEEESSGGISSTTSTGFRSLGDSELNDAVNNGKGKHTRLRAAESTSGKPSKPSQSPLPPYRIGIFSRCAESNYKWLSDSLMEDVRMRSLDIIPVYITNDYITFGSGLEECRFAILYHTQKHGRLNITNVTNSLYDDELKDMSNFLGRENVIVVADDLSSESEDKERILRHQHSIKTYAEDLFLFTEEEKYPRSLQTIREIIQRSLSNFKVQSNIPFAVHHTAPHRDGESSIRNSGCSVDSLKNRITPNQGFARDSSPSHSGSLGGQNLSQRTGIGGPQFKRSKTSPGEHTSSMEINDDLPEPPSPDLLSAPSKKCNDLQQGIQELRQTMLSQEETIKELRQTTLSQEGTIKELRQTMLSQEGTIKELRQTTLSQEGTIKELRQTMLSQEGTIKELRQTTLSQEGTIKELRQTMLSQEETIKELRQTKLSQEGTIKELRQTTLSQEGMIKELRQTTLSQEETIKELRQTTLSQEGTIKELRQTTLSQEGMIKELRQTTLSQEETIKELRQTTLS